MNKAVQLTYSLLRVVTGLLFFQAGAMKLFGWFGGMPGGGTPPLMSQVGIGGLLEDGLFKTRANPRSCFVSSSCIWPVSAQGCGASIMPSASHRISRGTRSLLCTSTH